MPATTHWYQLDVPNVLAELNSSLSGLTQREAAQRLAQLGDNAIVRRRPPTVARLFFRQFRSPLMNILLAAAIISYVVEEHVDAAVILSVVLFNAVVGLWQERKAGRAMDALQNLTPQEVTVVRDGQHQIVNANHLVRGDVVILETGNVVPADGRLVDAVNLKVNEAVFTGESLPVEKHAGVIAQASTVSEYANCAWRGTTVVGGRGRVVLTDTGMHTRLGGIVLSASQQTHEDAPFNTRLNRFTKQLTVAIVLLAALVFALGYFREFPTDQLFLLSVSLVVSLIPEGLPVVITLTLAWAMWQLAARKALVRKLTAVEALGSITTLAADKTGTLTYGEMMAEHIVTSTQRVRVTGRGYAPSGDFFLGEQRVDPVADPDLALTLKIGALCNDARFGVDSKGAVQPIGDPTELALVVAANKGGLTVDTLVESLPRVGEFPFDFSLRTMVTFHQQADGQYFIAVKGAPQQILALCESASEQGKVVPLPPTKKAALLQHYESLAARSLRGLATAYAITPDDWRQQGVQHLKNRLIFTGIFGLRDAVRPEAVQTIAAVKQAGIRLIMLTGDYRVTAETIAREIGLLDDNAPDRVLDGEIISQLDDAALQQRLTTIRVASRVSPEDKLRIARLLKARGEVLAMTGDGINDVPALTEATVGVAIGPGATDAAKEAADMVVTDGNLASIVAAIRAGRIIYRNIQRALIFLLATSVCELLLILQALVLDKPLPLLPTQIIWLNAVAGPFLALALAREPGKDSIMHEPPRSVHESILRRDQWLRIAFLAGAIALTSFLVFNAALGAGLATAQVFALTLTTIAFGEWMSAFAVRSHRVSLFHLLGTNRTMWVNLLIAVGMQSAILYIPWLAKAFHVGPITLGHWAIAIGAGLTVFAADEIRKLLIRTRERRATV